MMSLGTPDPPLTAAVRRQHVGAGSEVVRRLEAARLAQAERHGDLMRKAGEVEGQLKSVDGLVKRWTAADTDMDEVASLVCELAESVSSCRAAVQEAQQRLPELVARLEKLEREQQTPRVRALQKQLAQDVTTEMAAIEQSIEKRYRDSLQAAFEEQLRRYKESGQAPPPSFRARIANHSIAEVVLAADENERDEMEQFFGKE